MSNSDTAFEMVADLTAENKRLRQELAIAREALDSIKVYASDTLSGPLPGILDDRNWQREGVLEIFKRASKALSAGAEPKSRGDT